MNNDDDRVTNIDRAIFYGGCGDKACCPDNGGKSVFQQVNKWIKKRRKDDDSFDVSHIEGHDYRLTVYFTTGE